jgi:hypothetical protein
MQENSSTKGFSHRISKSKKKRITIYLYISSEYLLWILIIVLLVFFFGFFGSRKTIFFFWKILRKLCGLLCSGCDMSRYLIVFNRIFWYKTITSIEIMAYNAS